MRVCDCFRSHQQVCLWLCESTGEDSCGYSMAKSVDSVLPKILRLLKSFFLGPVLSFSLFNPSGIMFSLSFSFQHFVFYFFTWLSEECDPLASPGRCSDAVFFVDGLIFYPSQHLVLSFWFPDRPPSGLNNDLLERSDNFVTVAENGNFTDFEL